MKQEDEELLLKDLCMALPYGVICKCYHTEFDEWSGEPFVAKYNNTLKNIDVNGVFLVGGFSYEIDEIKPYLRPMSSMTEEEIKLEREIQQDCLFGRKPLITLTDFYYSRHLDVNGLIEKGLALEAPKGMYN